MFMKAYGLRVFNSGFVIHRDAWPVIREPDGSTRMVTVGQLVRGRRAVIRAMSEASRRRLEFIVANAAGVFKTLVTLTYHAERKPSESEYARNLRVVKRSKRDLNRLLCTLRRELGQYLWVQEFQARGVVHYHLMCSGEPAESRVSMSWCRATGESEDPAALRHAVKVEAVRAERGVRSYLGKYLGKERQKHLPPGVAAAGRWWGRSRSLQLAVTEEVVCREEMSSIRHAREVRVLRSVRLWLRRELGFRPSGGMFVDWGGMLSERLAKVVLKLRDFYGPIWREERRSHWSLVDATAMKKKAA